MMCSCNARYLLDVVEQMENTHRAPGSVKVRTGGHSPRTHRETVGPIRWNSGTDSQSLDGRRTNRRGAIRRRLCRLCLTPEPGHRMGILNRSVWSAHPGRPRRRGWRSAIPSLIFGAVLLMIWWLLSVSRTVPSVVLPNPADVAIRFGRDLLRGQILSYVWPTVVESLLGSLIAALIAFPLSYLVAHSRLLARMVEPYIALSQTIPLVALAPLLALWVGYGTMPIALLCALIAFFPMITAAVLGFRSLNPRVADAASLDGASGLQLLLHIELPLAAPALLAGLRAGLVLSVTGAIVGEFMMGGSGLATWLTLQRDRADTVGMFAVLIWVSGVALILHGFVHTAERRIAHRLDEREHRT